MTEALLVRLFSDAHVIDLDFSSWDDWVGILILADHLETRPDNARLPTVLVKFHGIRKFSLEMSHHSTMKSYKKQDPESHFQWHVDDFKYDNVGGLNHYCFWAGQDDPRLEIVCEAITYERLDTERLDADYPGWDKPGAGFVRPGHDRRP